MVYLRSEKITISLKVIEVENKMMPSFKAALDLVFLHPTGSMTFSSGNLWFGIEDWEASLVSMNSDGGNGEVADLSNDVCFRLVTNGVKTKVSMRLRRRIAGVGEGELKLDFDESSQFKEQFGTFAKSIKHCYEIIS